MFADLSKKVGAVGGVTLALLLAAVAPSVAQTTPPSSDYAIINLGTPGGNSYATDINNVGQVVGTWEAVQGDWKSSRSFLWDTAKGIRDLGTIDNNPFFNSIWAEGLNDKGQVAGSTPWGLADVAWLWDSTKGMRALSYSDPEEGEEIQTSASGINNQGAVVGSYNWFTACVWQNGVLKQLAAFDGGSTGALAINDNNQIAGWGFKNYLMRAVLWQSPSASPTALDALPGFNQIRATAINFSGHVVVVAFNVTSSGGYSVWGPCSSFLWRQGEGMKNLGSLGGQCYAWDINDKGQIVGSSDTAQKEKHAFLYQDGVMTDLNTLLPAKSGWVLHEARAINNKGEIVGYGTINGNTRAFLLSASAFKISLAPAKTKILGGGGTSSLVRTSLTAKVLDGDDKPVEGVELRFSSTYDGVKLAGALNKYVATTNAKGEAKVTLTSGATLGNAKVVATMKSPATKSVEKVVAFEAPWADIRFGDFDDSGVKPVIPCLVTVLYRGDLVPNRPMRLAISKVVWYDDQSKERSVAKPANYAHLEETTGVTDAEGEFRTRLI